MFITNLQNKSLISADRGTKATLMLTILSSLFKSYAKDLSAPIFELVFDITSTGILSLKRGTVSKIYDLCPKAMLIHDTSRASHLSTLSSMDSGLEAFSRNPTHGSFSALTFQSTEFANYANQRFLSY